MLERNLGGAPGRVSRTFLFQPPTVGCHAQHVQPHLQGLAANEDGIRYRMKLDRPHRMILYRSVERYGADGNALRRPSSRGRH